MIVLIANDLAPAVRGRLKLWFVEPKPNVFVSGIKDSLAEKVVDYLISQKLGAGSVLFTSISQPPGFRTFYFGITDKPTVQLSGFDLNISYLQRSVS